MKFKQKKSHYQLLREKWVRKHRQLQKDLWTKHKDSLDWAHKNVQHAAVGSALSGLLLLAAPSAPALPAPTASPIETPADKTIDRTSQFRLALKPVIPDHVRELTPTEEEEIGSILTKHFGFPISATLDGKRLNRSYGYIGAEQHLMRYPGDTMESHFDTAEESQKHYSSGMAPGRGAWGYFAPSQAAMTQKDKQREKYYIAVQTFLAPDFNSRVGEYRDFFKYRKMLLVNPDNGKAMVAVIGDAGPAAWTGKHLGGSPEVMKYLERVDGRAKGPVLYFFVDDPEDKIPLGPITL